MKLAFVGNCHADVLYRVLSNVYRDDKSLEIKYFRTHFPFTEADRSEIASSDMVIRQTADFSRKAADLATGAAKVVPFPLLLGQFLWPFNIRDHPRLGEPRPGCGDTSFFTYPVTDGQVIRLMTKLGVGPDSSDAEIEALLDEYMALDYSTLTNLERQLAISREKMRRGAEIVGYDLWSGIEGAFRTIPQFMTVLHPTDAVMRELCQAVLPRCGFPVTDSDITDALDQAYEGDSIFAYGAPVHPSVIRYFGMNVKEDSATYRFWCDGTITARALAKRIVMLDARQPVYNVLFGKERHLTPDEQIAALEEMIPSQAGNATFFLRYGNLLARLGKEGEALRIYAAGLQYAPWHHGLARRVAQGLMRTAYNPPVIVAAGDLIGFGTAGIGRNMLVGSNWNCGVDKDAVWLGGHTGGLRLRLSGPVRQAARMVELTFVAHSFSKADMQVRIYANGREVGLWDFGPNRSTPSRSLCLPLALLADPTIDLTFYVNRLVSPVELGHSSDSRRFGIGISQITVTST